MPKLLQINSVFNTGSTGKIVNQIALKAIENGWESYVAFSKGILTDFDAHFKIGSIESKYVNAFSCRLFDNDGFFAYNSTAKLLRFIEKVKPDVIHLHNLHGYYLNVEILSNFLAALPIHVVWTFHDCWPITGHCTHFEHVKCYKWRNSCFECPQLDEYPASLFVDNSNINYNKKSTLFNSISNLKIICPSIWLSKHVKNSFLSGKEILVINNGIDINAFKPRWDLSIYRRYAIDPNKKVILGVANIWSARKGLDYFNELAKLVSFDIQIVLVGLSISQRDNLSSGIIGILRTESIDDLAALYTIASVFVNPTLEDNFPTTNLEAMACGTPVVTFDTGGSGESVSVKTGVVIPKGDITALLEAVIHIIGKGKNEYAYYCRNHIIQNYNSTVLFDHYVDIYNSLTNFKPKK